MYYYCVTVQSQDNDRSPGYSKHQYSYCGKSDQWNFLLYYNMSLIGCKNEWLSYPSPVCGFLQHLTCRRGGGGVRPPSRSAPDGPRASRNKWACCLQWEEADGIQFYGPRTTGDLRGQVKHPNLATWDGDLADAIKPTKASESLSKWLIEQSKLP